MVRVDSFVPKDNVLSSTAGRQARQVLSQRLSQANTKTLLLSEARSTLSSVQEFKNDSALLETIEDAGWTVLHTWDGAWVYHHVTCVNKLLTNIPV